MRINKADFLAWLERDRFCEIVRADDGPSITVGQQPPLGSATATVGITGASAGYISGVNDNPDAGPDVAFAGYALKDAYSRYGEGGGELLVGGYPKQICCFVSNYELTADEIVPSAIATANIAALQTMTASTPLTLVAVTGAGITVTTAAFTVLNSQNVVPTGQRLIDALPTWTGFSQSGAVQAWNGAAVGRAVSITSGGGGSLAGITFTVRGYDLYGKPQSEAITGPTSAATVNGKKGWKWITSVTPSGSSALTVSIGTADIYEFPLRSGAFPTVLIWWNDALITANTGYTAVDTTSPATSTTGSVRGTYAVQSASDGTKKLSFVQRIGPQTLNMSPQSVGMFGVVPA